MPVGVGPPPKSGTKEESRVGGRIPSRVGASVGNKVGVEMSSTGVVPAGVAVGKPTGVGNVCAGGFCQM